MAFVPPIVQQHVQAPPAIVKSIYESKIFEITSLSEIFQYLSKPDERQLIIFDIDETLIAYKDALLRNGVNILMQKLQEEYKLSDARRDELMSIILKTASYELMEENIGQLFQDLSGHPNVIALTSCRTGKFATIDNVERWKTKLLSDFGINFTNHHYQDFNQMIFDKLLSDSQKETNKEYPIFIDGILYTGKRVDKGGLLKAFLQLLPSLPSKIIFIDDRKDYLENIQSALQSENMFREINFIGLHYNSPTYHKAIDDQIARIQKETLIQESKWLSDGEAFLLIN